MVKKIYSLKTNTYEKKNNNFRTYLHGNNARRKGDHVGTMALPPKE